MDITCPRCRRVDQVMKVSAIVRAGTAHATWGGTIQGGGHSYRTLNPIDVRQWTTNNSSGSVGGHTSSRTVLAASLAPPPQPAFEDPAGKLLGGFALCLLVGIFLIGAGISAATTAINPDAGHGIALKIFGGLVIALGILSLFRWPNASSQANIRHEEQMRIWSQQMGIWDHSYYCGRDDLVYVVAGFGSDIARR